MRLTDHPLRTRAAEVEADPRWAGIVERDGSGGFYYSVATSGVYCRPGCPARRPRPENVRFHATPAEARATGFRPCRRCRPDEPPREERHAATVADACRRLDREGAPVPLKSLAAAAGMSASHFHRVFRRHVGITPKAYADAAQARRVREQLITGGSVTDAIHDAGFTSSGRFYAHAKEILGMTPTTYRAGGEHTAIRYAAGECSLGVLLVAMSDDGICAVTLGDDAETLKDDLRARFPRADIRPADDGFDAVLARVVDFVEAPRTGLDLPLDVRGTAFQRRVWEALRAIPAGQTATYADVAERIGAPKAVRAVAGACAANKLAVVIPCHRVVRNDGSLSGYRWGVDRKRELLRREEEK